MRLVELLCTVYHARALGSAMDVFAQQQRCYSQYAARISAEMPPLAHRMHHLNANLAKRRMRVNASCSRPARQQPLFLGGGFGSTGTKSLLEAMKSLGFVVWHADRSTVPTTTRPSAFRAPIRAAWQSGATCERLDACDERLSRCDERLDKVCYRVPDDVDAYLDLPSAEAFLDLLWANRDVRVLLTRRRADDWVRSRLTKFGPDTNAPMDRPCGLRLGSFTKSRTARLFDLHAELIKCIVPASQLLEMHIEANHTVGLMSKLSWFTRGRELPHTIPAEFPVGEACRKECFGTFDDSESEVAEPTVAELEELVRRQNDLLSS